MTAGDWVADALRAAPVARLGTVDAHGAVRLVPICFAVVDRWLVSAVDHKPKRRGRLGRLDDIEATGTATVLLDHYEEDWSRLWWIRIRGRAVVHRRHPGDPGDVLIDEAVRALVAKYAPYRERPPAGDVYRIALDEVSSWRASDPAI